jgi:hypothetical protein
VKLFIEREFMSDIHLKIYCNLNRDFVTIRKSDLGRTKERESY